MINLVVKAILYGVDNECMLDAALSEADYGGDSELYDTSTVSKFEAALRSKDEASRPKSLRPYGGAVGTCGAADYSLTTGR